MEILVKICLMPLALKTQNDSFAFVHELKQEMHAGLKNVESLKDELDELECMYQIESSTTQTRAPQLTQTSRNTNPCMSTSIGVANNSHVKFKKTEIVQLILFIVDSGCTKHMTGNLSLLCNFVEKYLGTVRFGNDQFAPILGYGDLVQGNITIKRVYYVEGLNHNLFSVGQFCDADLEVAFRKSTCFVRDLQGNDLLTGNRRTDLYTISLQETTSSTPISLMAKASPTQAWLWHRRLSHLNFNYINLLLKKDVVIGLPKLKYIKDQLCSSCESKGYRVYSKRTRLIVESIHLRFAEIKEMSETSVANDTSGLVPQRQKASDYDNPDPAPELQNVSPLADTTSSSPADNSAPQDTYPSTNIHPALEPSTPTNVHAEKNNDNQAEFNNPFYTTVPSQQELDLLFGPLYDEFFNDEYRWTKDHPLTQVRGNPSKPVQTRRQLATDPEMCMFALTVSIVEPKNIKEAMADSAWIEAMQEELQTC
ncbi:integrase, catalytic region, zinc finger, CCHC-type containing protein [Tanacetum coccineum]